jgi:hypothetical protein
MYPDPARVRTYRYNVRLNQYEHEFLLGLANIVGTSPSTLIREMAFKQAIADITLEPQRIALQPTNQDDKQML